MKMEDIKIVKLDDYAYSNLKKRLNEFGHNLWAMISKIAQTIKKIEHSNFLDYYRILRGNYYDYYNQLVEFPFYDDSELHKFEMKFHDISSSGEDHRIENGVIQIYNNIIHISLNISSVLKFTAKYNAKREVTRVSDETDGIVESKGDKRYNELHFMHVDYEDSCGRKRLIDYDGNINRSTSVVGYAFDHIMTKLEHVLSLMDEEVKRHIKTHDEEAERLRMLKEEKDKAEKELAEKKEASLMNSIARYFSCQK